ncbi:MAG: ABC transporter ATP-binding protein [Lachnospiraceae bacterium]|nr:ABC transporter ATP-binding protein [Lachnospiraceae bacterium]
MGVTVEQFTKKRNNFTLGEIDFELPEGYILGVVGRNGSGKSTLFQSMLFGDCKDGGIIRINGKNGGTDGEERVDYRRQCAFVLEAFPFTDTVTAKDIGDIYGPFYKDFDKEKYRELLEKLEIPFKKRMKKLSTGMKLKVQMAFAFSYDSKVLFLDEPTASLDSFARKDLYRLIGEYMESGNRNVIWTTHLTEELDRMADYLLILEKGKQVLFEEKETLMSQYRVVKGSKHQLDCMKSRLIGRLDRETYSEGLVKTEEGPFPFADKVEAPTIEDLLCYLYGQKKSIAEYANIQNGMGA